MKYIKHVTVNTGHTLKYRNDTAVPADDSKYIKKIVDNVKNGCHIKLPGNTMLDCTVETENKIYSATIYGIGKDPVPLVETGGAVDRNGAEILWDSLGRLYKAIMGKEPPIECPEPPFICDIVLPDSIYRPGVLAWSGDFARLFGLEMLKELSKAGRLKK